MKHFCIKLLLLSSLLLIGCSEEAPPDKSLTEHLSWKSIDSGIESGLYHIIWDGKRFITGGSYGVLLSSLDGMQWQVVQMDNESEITGIEFANNIYLVSTSSREIFRSEDGKNWTSSGDFLDSAIGDIVWTGSFFIAASYHAFYTSNDGIKWNKVPFTGFEDKPNLSWDGVNVIADSYAYKNNAAVTVVKISSNGLDWKDASELEYRPQSFLWNDKLYAPKPGGSWIYEKENNKWNVVWKPKGSILTAPLLTSTFAGSKNELVSIGDHISWSLNGKQWYTSPIKMKSSGWLKDVVYGNDRYIAVGDYGAIIMGTYNKK